MNIKRAKEEIKHTVQAYLQKDEFGNYKIPPVNQRPILLIGPPGIGKTAIMEQVARECQIGLVSYTITHHTRQSAIGLPFIEEKTFGGKEYHVTEYTMSEIIASVYEKIEQTGLKEGILFLDEINCVSETLAPTMLQFLQGKTFGNHKVPDGFIIVSAGNPPEYNRSVREFDIVTLDRVRKMEIEEDFSVFKEYGYRNGIHDAILSYLELKKENFYHIETTVDGKSFVTARGWEDLSRMMYLYEELELPIDEELIFQYLQYKKTAKDFASYYELYKKYKTEYRINDILNGSEKIEAFTKLQEANFDEKLSVISLFLGKLTEMFKKVDFMDQFVNDLFEKLTEIKEQLLSEESVEKADTILLQYVQKKEEERVAKKKGGLLGKEAEKVALLVEKLLYDYVYRLKEKGILQKEEAMNVIREEFQKEIEKREAILEQAKEQLKIAFDFMEENFGQSQEMVIFLTELTANYYSMNYIREYGSEEYYRYHKDLLLSERKEELIREIQMIL
ncbi:MAG: AAA family ATPase [Clostridiales bacterium]|nr:AAA family ATPase [Clostridiales bacterium]